MTITDGLMTTAPSIEIAAALLAVQQKSTVNNSSNAPFALTKEGSSGALDKTAAVDETGENS